MIILFHENIKSLFTKSVVIFNKLDSIMELKQKVL